MTLRYQLPNGLTVILQESRASNVVAFQAWVQVGSTDEPPELAGIAHVFEHMLFKGTARRGVGEIAQAVEGAGGEINAWTSFDQTVYHLVLASRYFDIGLDVLSDALLHSSFDPVELERELKVVLEEIKQGEDNPSRVATQALFSAAYQRHPYRRPVIGWTRTVKQFSRARLLDFFRRYYVANNMTLVVVGNFDAKKARDQIARAFATAPSRPLARLKRSEPEQRRLRVKALTGDVHEVHLNLAFHIPGIRHPDTAAIDLGSIILGQGDSSRLTLAVKRGSELVSDAYAYSYTPSDPGLLVVGATLPSEKLDAALVAITAEVFRLRSELVTPLELRKAQSIVEADAVYQDETVQGLARKLGFFETVAGGLDYEAEYSQRVRAVTPDSLRQTVARYLTPENATITVLVPLAEAPRVKQLETEIATTFERATRATPKERPSSAKRSRSRARAANEIVRVDLPSGDRLLVLHDPSVALVAMRAVWLGGLRYEDVRTNGVNNLLAALIIRGTRSTTGDQFAAEVEGMAGTIGGFCGRNSFGMRMELLARHWERGLEIAADCILNPTFTVEELEKERRQVLEEIRTQEDNISNETFRLFSQTLYRRHPYRLDLIGTQESVSRLSRRRLLDYYAENVTAQPMTLALVGAIDPARVVDKARALFGRPVEKRRRELKTPELDPPTRQEVERSQNRQQAHVVYGFPGITMHHPDRFALEVLSTILSGQGGRLFVELRDRRGLAYRVSAFSVEGVDPGYVAVYIATSPENLEEAISGIEAELDKIRSRPVGRAELDRAKRYLVGAHEISLQRRAGLASSLSFHECYGLGADEYRRYAPSVLAVDSAAVRRVAERYLDPNRAIVATIRPEEDEAQADASPGKAASKAARAPLRSRSR